VNGPLFAGGESESLTVPTGRLAFLETVNAGDAAVKMVHCRQVATTCLSTEYAQISRSGETDILGMKTKLQ
jgi:hypothetical protein